MGTLSYMPLDPLKDLELPQTQKAWGKCLLNYICVKLLKHSARAVPTWGMLDSGIRAAKARRLFLNINLVNSTSAKKIRDSTEALNTNTKDPESKGKRVVYSLSAVSFSKWQIQKEHSSSGSFILPW